MNSPQDVISHAINHEIGHMVFNKSMLENKEEILKKLWREHAKSISQRAKFNEREFFAETFVMYRFEKNKLPSYIIEMIEKVIK